jgi:hypothetical protein
MPTGAGLEFGRLVQDLAGKAAHDEATPGEISLDRLVDGDARRIVAPVPEDAFSAGLRNQRVEHLRGRPPAQDEAAAALLERRRQRVKRMMQPPGLRRPKRPGAGLLRFEDIDRDDLGTLNDGGGERRMV